VQKAKSLRAAIEIALPELKREPGRLKVWAEDGVGLSRQTDSLSFGFRYRLTVLVEELAADIALLALALFRWLRVNQPDLLAPGAQGFAFDVDFLDNRTADVAIQLALTENVSVSEREEGGWQLDYLAEPDPLFLDDVPQPPLPADLSEIPVVTEVVTQAELDL